MIINWISLRSCCIMSIKHHTDIWYLILLQIFYYVKKLCKWKNLKIKLYLMSTHEFNKNFNSQIKWRRNLFASKEGMNNHVMHNIFKRPSITSCLERCVTCKELKTKLRTGWAGNELKGISEKHPARTWKQ